MNKRALFLVTLALTFVLSVAVSGCNAGQSALPTGQEVVQKVRETLRATNTAEGTIEVQLTLNKDGLRTLLGDAMSMVGSMIPKGGTGMAYDDMINALPGVTSAKLEFWGESPDKVRLEVESFSLPGATGATLVSDGQKLYAYSPTNHTIYTASRATLEEMREEFKDMPANMGMGFLGDFSDPEAALDKLLEATDLRVTGTEKVGERDSYKLEATPKPDAAERRGFPEAARVYVGSLLRDAKATVWVDKEQWVPLKAIIEHPSVGQLTYTGNWKLNGSVDADRFVLQVPPGTTTTDMDQQLESLDYWSGRHYQPETVTLVQAREIAHKDGWKLLEPTYLPEGATLVEVQKIIVSGAGGPSGGTMERRESIGFNLSYSAPQSDFLIQEMPTFSSTGGDGIYGNRSLSIFGVIRGSGVLTSSEGWEWLPYLPAGNASNSDTKVGPQVQSVTVRGVQGSIVISPNSIMLFWMETGNRLTCMIAGKLTPEEALKIAEGLK